MPRQSAPATYKLSVTVILNLRVLFLRASLTIILDPLLDQCKGFENWNQVAQSRKAINTSCKGILYYSRMILVSKMFQLNKWHLHSPASLSSLLNIAGHFILLKVTQAKATA